MSVIAWNSPGEKVYELGLDRGVLYPQDGNNRGVPWNGFVSLTEGSSEGEHQSYYFNGRKYYNRVSPEEANPSIQAYTYPRELEPSLGYNGKDGLYFGGQSRRPFSFVYRTEVESDAGEVGTKIHIVYDAIILPHSVERNSKGLSSTPNLFSFEISTSPVQVKGRRFSSHLVVDSRETNPMIFRALERVLYGSDNLEPFLPRPDALVDMFETFEPTGYGYGPYGRTPYGHGNEDERFNQWLYDGLFAEGMKHWNHTQSGQGRVVDERDGVGPAFEFSGRANSAIDTPLLIGGRGTFAIKVVVEIWVESSGVRPGQLELVRNNNNASIGVLLSPTAGQMSAGWNRIESTVRSYNFSSSIEPPGVRLQIRQAEAATRNLACWRIPNVIIT